MLPRTCRGAHINKLYTIRVNLFTLSLQKTSDVDSDLPAQLYSLISTPTYDIVMSVHSRSQKLIYKLDVHMPHIYAVLLGPAPFMAEYIAYYACLTCGECIFFHVHFLSAVNLLSIYCLNGRKMEIWLWFSIAQGYFHIDPLLSHWMHVYLCVFLCQNEKEKHEIDMVFILLVLLAPE